MSHCGSPCFADFHPAHPINGDSVSIRTANAPDR